jgi:hypothetical protein
MDCAQARFLLYAYLDRDLSPSESQALARHLAHCRPCETRSRSARGAIRLLRSRLDRAPAPQRLRLRLQGGAVMEPRPRYAGLTMAAAVVVFIVPIVAGVPALHSGAVSAAGIVWPAAAPLAPTAEASRAVPVSRLMTGTVVCLDCDSRQEAGLCPLPHARHQAGLCADNGEVWRLMTRDSSFLRQAEGQTVTLEGVAFPRSGFLRASRLGY